MKSGNWIPLSKALVRELPTDRPFSKVEAAFSLQVDYDQDNPVTVAGYAKRWNWTRKKVMNFLEEIGVYIAYPQNTTEKQNQKGQIRIQKQRRTGTEKEQINFINNRELPPKKNRCGTDQEQKRGRSGNTTTDTGIPDTSFSGNPPEVPLSGSAPDDPPPMQLVNPGFSSRFIDTHWKRWLRLKKGGKYRNAEAESIALETLFNLCEANEAVAAEALKTAIAGHGQSFLWCFRPKNHQPQQNHETDQHGQIRPHESGQQFGADNLRWLERHARTSCPEIGQEFP
jgi:hypothetical protein